MFKALGRIRKDRVKMIVKFSALSVNISTMEDIHLLTSVSRGDQKPLNLPVLRVGAKRGQQTAQLARNSSDFECSYFVQDGVPDPKMAKIQLYATDAKGKNPVLMASIDVNFSMHFGAQYEEQSQKLEPSAVAQSRNINCESVRFRAQITVKKDKERPVLEQCIAWCTDHHTSEQRMLAKLEQEKQAEVLRKEAARKERQRQQAEMQSTQPIRGFNALRTQSMAAPDAKPHNTFQDQSSNLLKTAEPPQTYQTSSMLDDIQKVDKKSARMSQNRMAANVESLDGRNHRGALTAALERSFEGSSEDEGDDPFGSLLTEKKMRTGSTAVAHERRPSRFIDSNTAILAAMDENNNALYESRKSTTRSTVLADVASTIITEEEEDKTQEEYRSSRREEREAVVEAKNLVTPPQANRQPAAGVPMFGSMSMDLAASGKIQGVESTDVAPIDEDDKSSSDDSEELRKKEVIDQADRRLIAAQKARELKEEQEKDAEIEELQAEIDEHEKGRKMMDKLLQVEKEYQELQKAIENANQATEQALKAINDEERSPIFDQIKQHQIQIDEFTDSNQKLKNELILPLENLKKAEQELIAAKKMHEEATADGNSGEREGQIQNILAERRAYFETESAEVQKEIAQVAELETKLQPLTEEAEEITRSVVAKQEQITAIQALHVTMEQELEGNINECDRLAEQLDSNEVHEAKQERINLKHEISEQEAQKIELKQEQVEMRNKGIELQSKIQDGKEKVEGMTNYIEECDAIVQSTQVEIIKFEETIAEQKEEQHAKQTAEKEREKIKKKIAARKARERQKTRDFEVEMQEERQRTESQAALEIGIIRAATLVEKELNGDSGDSFHTDEDGADNKNESIRKISQEQIVLDELKDKEASTSMFYNQKVDESRVTQQNEVSFFSQGPGQSMEWGKGTDASQVDDYDDEDDGGAFNFDALMKEKAARDTFRMSEQRPEIPDIADDQAEKLEVIEEDHEPQHFQTPSKPVSQYFETDESNKQNTMTKIGVIGVTTAFLESQKSVTEPATLSSKSQITLTESQAKAHQQVTATSPSGTPDPEWLQYNEQQSSPLLKGAVDEDENDDGGMMDQIDDIEKPGLPMGDNALMQQMNGLKESEQDDNSDYDSFKSEEADEVVENDADESLPIDKKRRMTQGTSHLKRDLTEIKEMAESDFVSHLDDRDITEMDRAPFEHGSDLAAGDHDQDETPTIPFETGSAVAANLMLKIDHEEKTEDNFGAVCPTERFLMEATDIPANEGSVQVVKEQEIDWGRQSAEESKAVSLWQVSAPIVGRTRTQASMSTRPENKIEKRMSSYDIKQKILLASTMINKVKIIAELNQELVLVKEDIVEIQNQTDLKSSKSQRSRSMMGRMSMSAVPTINRSTQDRLNEKYTIQDQIEKGINSLEEKDLKEQEHLEQKQMPQVKQEKNRLTVLEEDAGEDEEISPDDCSLSFFGDLPDFDQEDGRVSRLTAYGQNRSSVRASAYRSTHFDRQKARQEGKSRKQIFTDQAMRDIYFQLVSKKHLFAAVSDYEVMEGFNQFETMLRKDKTCHEAMFGLGKLNFLIKRYEIAERWFQDAFEQQRDYVYRAWLGFTYIQLYRAVTPENPKRAKYLGYAVKNLTRCVKEDDLAPYATNVLLYLAIDLKNAGDPICKGLEEPRKYLEALKTLSNRKSADLSIEVALAECYIDLNTPGMIQKALTSIKKLIFLHPGRPEPYLMGARHHAQRKEYADEKRLLNYAMQNATDYHSYPERLMLTMLQARNLSKTDSKESHLEALDMLQMQYTRTPHFASPLLYAYGKIIIDCEVKALIPNAISALEEAQRISVSLRVHSCFAYISKAFQLLERYPVYAYMHALSFQAGSKHLTYRVGETSQNKKQLMIEEIIQSNETEVNTRAMYDIIQAVKEMAAQAQQSSAISQPCPRYSSSVSFVESPQSSVSSGRMSLSTNPNSTRLNTFSSPLLQLQVKQVVPKQMKQDFDLLLPLDEEHERQEKQQMAEGLIMMTSRFDEVRDRIVCKGLIIRSLTNKSKEAHEDLLQDLCSQTRLITETSDVQLQSLKVRCLRKLKTEQSIGMDPLEQGFLLMEMVRSNQMDTTSYNTPLTTVCLVEAHIEMSKLFFALSQQENTQTFSRTTLINLALTVLLMLLPMMPQVDFKLGNPQLPVEMQQYEMKDLDTIDFSDARLMQLGRELEEYKEEEDSLQYFVHSALMKHKVAKSQFLVEGHIPVDPKKQINQVQAKECAKFTFREAMAKGRLDLLSQSWSATSLSTVSSFLQSEGIPTVKKPTIEVQQRRLAQFHVHSNPDVLKQIGKICIKSGHYADLAINVLNEYLQQATYSKMFTMAAGISINDDAAIQSGYTFVRDQTILLLSQALAQLAFETYGAKRDELLEKGQTLLTVVQKGANNMTLEPQITKTATKLQEVVDKP